MKRLFVILTLIALLIVAGGGNALAENASSPVIPIEGQRYGQLSAQWWQWAMSFPAANVPFFNNGGAVDISAGQSSNTWFLAGEGWGQNPVVRTGSVPAGTYLFLPLANLNNDYPCPDPSFEPAQGQSLKDFLQTGGNAWFNPDPTDLFAEIDGAAVTGLTGYKATSNLYWFTADPALATFYDPCITSTPQRGVSVGYWLLLAPLSRGTHTLHFGAPSWGQDITYVLAVTAN